MPCYEFLVKDIMAPGDSWQDDAFSGKKLHGWEDWVQNRRLLEKFGEEAWV